MIRYGTPVSAGIVLGRIYVYDPREPVVEKAQFPEDQLPEQLALYAAARTAAAEELTALADKLAAESPDQAKIFLAHLEILHDEAMDEDILQMISAEHWRVDHAVETVYRTYADMLSGVPDPLIAERAADITDIKKRLLRILSGGEARALSTLSQPVILAARDLLPSDTATLDRKYVLAILTEQGGPTSHSAILARSYGIPAVVGIPGLLSGLRDGEPAAVDAVAGTVETELTPETEQAYADRRAAFQMEQARTEAYLNKKAVTKDGVEIEIGLNIGSAGPEALSGAEAVQFVGLFRTEFLYMDTDHMPTEEEQYLAYRQTLEGFGDKPVTLRTLDIGADKTLSYYPLPQEENPALGRRALRLCLAEPAMFRTQLRAALRASVYGKLWLMLPMVGSMDDIRMAKEQIALAKAELDKKGLPYDPAMRVGIMIEIPSIALIADKAAQAVDFASIGTNDLCQYLTASDRLNAETAAQYQCLHPGMLRLMGYAIRQFQAAGKPISVCGEMGGDPMSAALLTGLGLRKLSMSRTSISSIKEMLSKYTLEELRTAAQQACQADTAAQVEQAMRAFLQRPGI